MTPSEYLSIVVLPTVSDLLEVRDDRRLAYLACISAYHLADHIAHARGESGTKLVMDELLTLVEDHVRIVQGMANGTKHPKKRQIAPGDEQYYPAFALDVPNSGYDVSRLDNPGLGVEAATGAIIFIDTSVQLFILASAVLYPDQVGAVSLVGFDPQILGSIDALKADARLLDRK